MPETTTTPAPAESPVSTGAGASGSYVQSLIEPGIDSAEVESSPSSPPAPQTTTETQQAETGTTQVQEQQKSVEPKTETTPDQKLEELIQQFAQEMGLDSKDPNQRKTLKRLADKELFIQQLQGKLQTQEQKPDERLLTEFEKSLAADNPEAAPATVPAAVEQPKVDTKPPEPFKYGDIGDEWKSVDDSLTALNQAWTDGDLSKVHAIDLARQVRNFDSYVAPRIFQAIEARLQQFMQKDLGDVVPAVRESIETRQLGEDRDFAVDQLRTGGASEIDKLFEPIDDTKITFEGHEFANTPLNQMLQKFPSILQIKVSHKDPRVAQRLSMIERYRMAYQLHKREAAASKPPAVSPGTAKELVQAGKEMQARSEADRARQAINAGPGATGSTEKSRSASYVGSLNALPGEVPFSSLF